MKALSDLSVHTKIFLGWGFCICGGLYGFILSKRYITSRRYENMKARERIRQALDEESKPGDKDRKLTW